MITSSPWPKGADVRVNSYTTSFQARATIALDGDGDYVIVWDSNGQDGSGYDIYAQRYNANTTPILADQMFAVNEHAFVGTVVGTAPATVPDSFNTLTYSFSGGNINKAFAINPTTGQITVARPFTVDFETLSTYTLRVQATDNLGASRKANVTVNLNDINEQPTLLPQTFNVNENSPAGTLVGQVLASDVDIGDTLTYIITGGNVGKAFALNSTTGLLTVNKAQFVTFEAQQVINL